MELLSISNSMSIDERYAKFKISKTHVAEGKKLFKPLPRFYNHCEIIEI